MCSLTLSVVVVVAAVAMAGSGRSLAIAMSGVARKFCEPCFGNWRKPNPER